MKSTRYPNIIKQIIEEDHFTENQFDFKNLGKRIDLNKLKEKNADDVNKVIIYLAVALISAISAAFLLIIGNISDDAFQYLSGFFENIPFLDLHLSRKVISDLRFPNPVTVAIILTTLLYAALAVYDTSKSNHKNDLFKESTSISYGLHMLFLLLIISSVFLSWKPKPKIQISEIEYIPTQIESKKPPPTDTKKRAIKQSIDSGKHDPNKEVKPIDKPIGKPKLPSAQQPQPKPKASSSQPKSPFEFKPLPRDSVPVPKPISSSPREALIKSNLPERKLPNPLNYSPSQNVSNDTQENLPNPKEAGASSSTRSSNLVARLTNLPRLPDSSSTGLGGGQGSYGNPNANQFENQAPSLAARADADFGPYMSGLQRKIKYAWKPPRGTESNRIVVVFSVDRAGVLHNLRLTQSSRFETANAAALEAVRRASPFDPLPSGAPAMIEIEFTFDYNVFQKTRW